MSAASALAEDLRAGLGLAHKRDIAAVTGALGLGADSAIPVGDDCAAIPDGDGWLLLAG
jgi:selenophosphate synthetase-related protein